jgi:glycosyltransferase involved in cell wall biosynthesis
MLVKQIKTPLSIIVPVLNEAGNLPLLFERIDLSLTSASIPYEIIVVDDHSSDNTVNVAKNADPKYNVVLLEKQGEAGKSFSLLEGFSAASFSLVCMIDGDLQYPPEAIPAMYQQLDKSQADIVLTERNASKTSHIRQLSSYVYNLLFVRLLFGIRYDTQSGLKLFKKEVLENIDISPSPWSFDLEFIVRSLEKDYIIVSHEIEFGARYAGVPKVKILSATVELIHSSIKLRRQTASKVVKLNYRNLRLLQRTSSWIIALLTATFIAFTLHSTASADGLNTVAAATTSGAVQTVEQGIQKSVSDVDKSLDSNKTKSAKTSQTSTPAMTTTTSSSSNGTGSTSSADPSSTSGTTSSSTASTPTATSTPITSAGSSINTNTTQSVAATKTGGSTSNSSAPPTSTTYQAKNTAYYVPSKLGASSTQRFLKIAAIMIEVGGIFIVLGIIFLGVKPTVIRRQQSHPLRS